MINLISIEEKKRRIKDFYLRFLVVFFTMVGFSIMVGSILLSPSYFISSMKKNTANNKLETQKKEILPLIDQGIPVIIKNFNQKLALVEKSDTNKFVVSEKVINEVLLHKTSGIKITAISYINDFTLGKKININGTALSREKLQSFQKSLQNDPNFLKVDLPISNFIKGSNLEFSLNLISS